MKEISVEKAIENGKKRRLIFLSLFLISGFFITLALTTNLIDDNNKHYIIILPFGLFITLFLTIIIGNKLGSKWKLWAFSNVQNVSELRIRAIQESLMYENSPFMEKIEFRSKNEITKWNEIMLKFSNKIILTENEKLQEVTEVSFSIYKNLYNFFIYILSLIFFICLGMNSKFTYFSIFLICGILILSLPYLRNLFNLKPQLIFNKNGIVIKNKEIMKWENISNEQIIANSRTSELYFIHNEKEEIINIKNLNVSKLQLKEILETYRIRNHRTTANSGLQKLGFWS